MQRTRSGFGLRPWEMEKLKEQFERRRKEEVILTKCV